MIAVPGDVHEVLHPDVTLMSDTADESRNATAMMTVSADVPEAGTVGITTGEATGTRTVTNEIMEYLTVHEALETAPDVPLTEMMKSDTSPEMIAALVLLLAGDPPFLAESTKEATLGSATERQIGLLPHLDLRSVATARYSCSYHSIIFCKNKLTSRFSPVDKKS